MPDSLRELVNERDRRMTPVRLGRFRRSESTQRLCLVCRRHVDPEMHQAYRASWLAANPLPFDHRCRYGGIDDHGWCVEAFVLAEMPRMAQCPHDAGELVEITV